MLRRLVGARYVVPLREGGSLPAVVDTDAGGTFVVKFRGAGQGPKALVAEALVAGIARALGLPVPEPALVELSDGFGRAEPDPEIQDILRGSVGLNFGLAYLRGALAFDPAVDGALLAPSQAADIVWLDAFLTNIDRTARNTNLLVLRDSIWMIDHGAALYVHHRWAGWEQRVQSPFPQIAEHVLLPFADDVGAADERLRQHVTDDLVREVVASIPDEWLAPDPDIGDADAQRIAYERYLRERLDGPRTWLAEAGAAMQRPQPPLARRATHRVV